MTREKSKLTIARYVQENSNSLDDFIRNSALNQGGLSLLEDDIIIYEIHNFNGRSGFNYWSQGKLMGQLHLMSLSNGEYCVYRKTYDGSLAPERYDFFNKKGEFTYTSEVMTHTPVSYHSETMDDTGPFVNHLYNVLFTEYKKTEDGKGDTARITLCENILRSLATDSVIELTCDAGPKDKVLLNIERRIEYLENEKVLTWEERRRIYSDLLELRQNIINTKKRCHKFSFLRYIVPLKLRLITLDLRLFKKRPLDNFRGLLYKYTIGNILWFFKTVKENLGYSVALAIYGPFTYYFITQPMNPHAMWAVGKMRDSYISTVHKIDSWTAEVQEEKVQIQNEEIESVDNFEWNKRMGQFKAMNIAYESNLVFAERMGRLEQIETQFNLPLNIESSWHEIQRYKRAIKNTQEYVQNMDPQFRSFLESELRFAFHDEIYLWKKMRQLFLDYPFILVDQNNEHTAKDYYSGRAFVLMKQMTDALSENQVVKDYLQEKKIIDLANSYSAQKIETSSVMANLKANTELFKGDFFDHEKLRSTSRRQWEVLFLQQNKKQEASSFGLQAYMASIKNAIWTLQSLYSIKRDDLSVMSYKFNLANKDTSGANLEPQNNELLEGLLHFIVYDYVSIRKELKYHLDDDKEYQLREKLIGNFKEYIEKRESLFEGEKKNLTNKVTGNL